MIGVPKPKSVMITTSPHLSPEILSATTVTAPVSSSVLHHHHHYNDVTSQDGDTLKRKRKTKKQKDDVFFCNFPNHEGLVSRDPYMVMQIKLVVIVIVVVAAAAIHSSFSLGS